MNQERTETGTPASILNTVCLICPVTFIPSKLKMACCRLSALHGLGHPLTANGETGVCRRKPSGKKRPRGIRNHHSPGVIPGGMSSTGIMSIFVMLRAPNNRLTPISMTASPKRLRSHLLKKGAAPQVCSIWRATFGNGYPIGTTRFIMPRGRRTKSCERGIVV